MTHNTDDTAPRNTKDRGRCWGPCTWNNYKENDYEILKTLLETSCEDWAIQEEIGKNGTPHLQFCMKFKNARTFSSIKKKLPECHIEKSRNWAATKNYCSKKDTRSGKSDKHERRKIKNPLDGKELYEWQQQLLNDLAEEPDDRTIIWIVDYIGNNGKTAMAKHLCLTYPNETLYMSGKASDIKYGVFQFVKKHELKVCLFDFPRTLENFVSYDAIESIKNGIFYNTKYESEMCMFNPPHVVIFSNWYPDVTKLSSDRWKIIELNDCEDN